MTDDMVSKTIANHEVDVEGANEFRPSRSLWRLALRKLSRNPVGIVTAALLAMMTLLAVFAPIIAAKSPTLLDPLQSLRPPSASNLFGTDSLGRDVFSRVVYGSRVSLRVGLAVVVVSTILGAILGLAAGYYRAIDNLLMRTLDGLMAFPGDILALALLAALGSREINVIVALVIVYSPRTARIVRASTLSVRQLDYVEAVRAQGAGDRVIMFRHILPNCLSPLLVQATTLFAYAILAEAGLSFLGVGVPPTVPSWGSIISEGRQYIGTAPWLMFFPGALITLAVLSLNLFGDALRDALDPRDR